MELKEFYDVGELLCSDKIDDFRHVEAFTRDLVDMPYAAQELIDKVQHDKKAMQKLGFITEVALEYANKKGVSNPELLCLHERLTEWRGMSELEHGVLMATSGRHMRDYLRENSTPKAREWGILSTYSAKDFEKFQ